MKLILVTIILVYSSPMFCNAKCTLELSEESLYCENTSFEEYKNFILNEVKQPIIRISFSNTTITSLNNTFFDFEQIKDVRTFDTKYCSIEKVEAFTFSNLKKLQYLYFQYNDVPLEINQNALQGLDSLEQFDTYSCKITHIEPGTFAGLTKLRIIYWYYNNITTLKAGTFLGATHLTDLWLQESQISHIEPNAFDGLDNLVGLRLWGNKIKTLPLGLFKNLNKLVSLELYNNWLDSLNFEALEGLSSLENLVIGGNNIEVLDVTDIHKYTPNLKTIPIQ